MDRPVEITRSYAECKFCNDIADMCNEIPDCTHCENRKGTWIDTITSLLGTKAVVVLEDGKVETYDKAECLEFMEKLYHHMGWPTEKLHENPAFAEVIKEKEA